MSKHQVEKLRNCFLGSFRRSNIPLNRSSFCLHNSVFSNYVWGVEDDYLRVKYTYFKYGYLQLYQAR